MASTAELSLRRRIVYHGLKGHVAESSLMRAVALCDAEFQTEPTFSVARFLKRLSEVEPILAARQSDLYIALSKLRGQNGEQIGPDPAPPAAAVATATAPPRPSAPRPAVPTTNGTMRPIGTAAVPPTAPRPIVPPPTAPRPQPRPQPQAAEANYGWPQIFNALMIELFTTLRQTNPNLIPRVNEYLGTQKVELALSADADRELSQFLAIGSAVFTARTKRSEMHQILHQIYLWSCEEIGPVGTDRIYKRSIREVENLPTATQYPPQALM